MGELETLRNLAISIARDAGTLMMDGLATAQEARTKASPTDLVTQIDVAVEALIVKRLRHSRPGDGILSEEGTSSEGTSGVRWICDPLDGTANYVRRRHPFVVSLAVMVGDAVRVAVVYDPWLDELYDAISGGGARLNGASLHCSTQRSLDLAVIGTAFGRKPQERAVQAGLLRKLLPHLGDIRRSGAAVYDICAVAANRAEGYFYYSLKPWDLLAAGLIATEAGARVHDLSGNPARPGETMLAAAPELADALRELLAETMSLAAQTA